MQVAYLALAHNERDGATGVSKAKVIHNFGREGQVDRTALSRLVRAISRFLDPEQALAAAVPGEVDVLDARPMGTANLADRLWERLGVAAAIRRVAADRRLDPTDVERVIFSMVANRFSPTPLSKLAGTDWVAKRVFIDGLPGPSEDACYRPMDFFLEALPELHREVFFAIANLLNLEVDLLFFDGSSTYFERDSADAALVEDEVRLNNGTSRDRFVICHNPEHAAREAQVRTEIVARLKVTTGGSDRWPSAPRRACRQIQDQTGVGPVPARHRRRASCASTLWSALSFSDS